MTPFDVPRKEAFENIVGKGEIACTSNFSFSHNVFYSVKDRNDHFCYICRLQMLSIWSGKNFVVWEWVNTLTFNQMTNFQTGPN